jgi:pimeloyl-ACP methyl ester carboxylesterase
MAIIVESHISGSPLHFLESGQGRTVLFLHSYMLNGNFWLDQIEHFADSRRCIAPDFRGHGKSALLGSRAVEPERDATEINTLLDHLDADRDGPMDIVAAAAGGIVAGLAVIERPERFRSLTMISTLFCRKADPALTKLLNERAQILMNEGKEPLFQQYNGYLFGPATSAMVRTRYKTMFKSCPYETILSVLTGTALDGRPDVPAQLRLPVFVPYGADDFTMKDADSRAAYLGPIADLRTVELAEGARLLSLEYPEKFNALLLDFWSTRLAR